LSAVDAERRRRRRAFDQLVEEGGPLDAEPAWPARSDACTRCDAVVTVSDTVTNP
jgi:hypothetical protein